MGGRDENLIAHGPFANKKREKLPWNSSACEELNNLSCIQEPQHGRREPSSTRCPLTSTCIPWHTKLENLPTKSSQAWYFKNVYNYYCVCRHVPWCIYGGQRTTFKIVLLFYCGFQDWSQLVRLALQTFLSTEPLSPVSIPENLSFYSKIYYIDLYHLNPWSWKLKTSEKRPR